MPRAAVPTTQPTAAPERLEAWLPKPAIRTRHRRASTASPEALWAAAQEVRLSDTRALGRLIRWRIPGTPPELPYAELFARAPFVVLQDGPGWSVSGLCGRIWTLTRDYPELRDLAAFLDWDVAGTVRVAFAHWVEETDGGTALCSEARVQPVDARASFRLRPLWLAVGPFERLIGAEPLALANARATA
ncbi:MAG: hypothetical protein JHC95_18580 [Solirubrobacteraceae bacterium]|nr:hypothetical protein [Solirubrobacteraceae bacterium]